MAQLVVSPAASGDDAREVSGGTTTINDTAITLAAGSHWAGIRFPNVTIPRTATIDSATLSIYIDTNDDPLVDIYGEDVDNSAIFTTAASDVSGRTRTSQKVDWDGTNIGTGRVTLSVALGPIVAAIIGRTNWASGNALTLIFDSFAGSNVSFRTFDHASGEVAQLTINYTTAAGVTKQAMFYARQRRA